MRLDNGTRSGTGTAVPALTDVLEVLAGLDPGGNAPAPVVRIRPPRPGQAAPWPSWVPPGVLASLTECGAATAWAHQATAADLAWQGSPVVVCTGPASGKSLAYQVPALAAAVADGGTTLYLSPTTALAADQADRLARLAPGGIATTALDGDSSADHRRWARDRAHVVLTTPDLVHHSLLPQHAAWARFLRRLRFVVIDECHAYRGVFGAHVAAVLRRLLRAARLRGARPVVIACSATAADPGPFVAALAGLSEVAVVADDGAPHPGSAVVVHAGSGRRPEDTAGVFAGAVGRGLQTVAFTGSRAGAEALARRTRRTLEREGTDPGTAGEMVASYRAGHLAQERRQVESAMRDGRLRGVATTSALEVGVDVSGLDVVVLDGWPGSRTALEQRAGRSGRAGRAGVTVLVAGDGPVDAHVVARPDEALGTPVEAAVTDPDNPHVLSHHLVAAALESPLTDDDLDTFGGAALPVVQALEARGDLRRRPAGWYWARREQPRPVDIRAAGGGTVTLLESATGRVLGTVDEARACRTVHPGAVYLHRWDTYVVEDLDLGAGVALLTCEDPGWTTVAEQSTDVDHIEVVSSSAPGGGSAGSLSWGTVGVRSTVTGYTRRDRTGRVLDRHPLDLPARVITTRGVWWQPAERVPAGGLHAAEHVLAAMLPMVVPCDRFDVGSRTADATVTVWDAWPGGAGYAERGYRRWQAWTAAAAGRLADCRCESGCPSCVVQAGCGSGNRRLDKAAAARLLTLPD